MGCSFAFSNAFVSGGLRGGARAAQVLVRDSAYDAPGFVYEKNARAQSNLEYYNDVGFFPDGTPYNRAGNAVNHPETIGPDPHKDGSALPSAVSVNDVGYFVNHPELIGPDPHTPGSALPGTLKGYVNDIGYTPDGTPMDRAGNLSLK